jgi:hypothetical protein
MARRVRAAARSGATATAFSEIFGAQPRPLPTSVVDALAALALARHPPSVSLRSAPRP